MEKVKSEVGFDRGIKVGESSGLLFLGGVPATQFRTEIQDTGCKKKVKYEYRVYTEQVKIFPFFILGSSENLLPVSSFTSCFSGLRDMPKRKSVLTNQLRRHCLWSSCGLQTHGSAKTMQNIFFLANITLPQNIQYLSQPYTFLFDFLQFCEIYLGVPFGLKLKARERHSCCLS